MRCLLYYWPNFIDLLIASEHYLLTEKKRGKIKGIQEAVVAFFTGEYVSTYGCVFCLCALQSYVNCKQD